ncbi:hypothetical protein G3I54_22600 [Streptomyces sp. SID14515]|nr:hypothetical protein [Streptomyces sp. SID14515]
MRGQYDEVVLAYQVEPQGEGDQGVLLAVGAPAGFGGFRARPDPQFQGEVVDVPVDGGAADRRPCRAQSPYELVDGGGRGVRFAAQAGLAQGGQDGEAALGPVEREGGCGRGAREFAGFGAGEDLARRPYVEGQQVARRGQDDAGELERHGCVDPAGGRP